jgi:hypothetical protein
MLDEKDFQKKADTAFDELKRRNMSVVERKSDVKGKSECVRL